MTKKYTQYKSDNVYKVVKPGTAIAIDDNMIYEFEIYDQNWNRITNIRLRDNQGLEIGEYRDYLENQFIRLISKRKAKPAKRIK